MPVKTFIYGTPLGFNFYEDDSQYKDYFKGFYISSREGRRLMVNRLDNGETTYNFLCYRIAENHNRPNAFFGMSLVLSDYQYCSNFSKLYDWFDFLFDKLVNEHSLFKLQGNELQYNVSKFEDDREDVEWLKSNIPNILSSPDIKLQKYDASFSNKKTGQIIQFNNSEPIDKVLKAFKQSRWISISPIFVDQEDCLELDYMELSQNIESITKQLLPIAIKPEQKHLAILQDFQSILKENHKSISEFVKKTKDEESKKQFTELGQRYYSILTQELPQIAEKIKEGSVNPPLPTQICSKCGQQKSLNEFANGDAICADCRAHESAHNTRVCEKCGRTKPLNAFESDDSVCKSCRNEETSGFVLPFPKKFLLGGVAIIVLAIFIVGIQRFIPKPLVKGHKSPGSSIVTIRVDERIYQDYINNNDFLGAYNYINEKENAQEYKPKLKESYEQFLLSLTFEQIQKNLIESDDLCTSLEIDKHTWDLYVKDGNMITAYFGKPSISDSDRRKCNSLINRYKTGIYQNKAEEWGKLLASMPIQRKSQPGMEGNIGVTYLYRINNKEKLKMSRTRIGIDLKKNQYVDIFGLTQEQPPIAFGDQKFPTNQIGWHTEDGTFWRIVIKDSDSPGTTYLFKIGSSGNELTITVKAKYGAE